MSELLADIFSLVGARRRANPPTAIFLDPLAEPQAIISRLGRMCGASDGPEFLRMSGFV
jgi:hypothetical protein